MSIKKKKLKNKIENQTKNKLNFSVKLMRIIMDIGTVFFLCIIIFIESQ